MAGGTEKSSIFLAFVVKGLLLWSLSLASLIPEPQGRTAIISPLQPLTCYNKQYTEVQILVKENDNEPFVTSCVDPETVTTLWSKSVINGTALANPLCRPNHVCPCDVDHEACNRKHYKWADKAYNLPDVSFDHSYGTKNELKTFSEILGSSKLAKQYMPPKSTLFLAKGHLSPNGDGVWDWERSATFFYINAVPQWQSINAGNWVSLETNARKYAKDNGIVLHLWTGAIGVATLKDVRHQPKELYIARDSRGKIMRNKLPVPRLMWKALYDPVNGTGLVVVMLNNPWPETHLHGDRMLCPQGCEKTDFVNWNIADPKKGFTVCCSTAEFKKAFPGISAPGLDDLGDLPLLGGKIVDGGANEEDEEQDGEEEED